MDSRVAKTADRRVTVVYIAGSGRSGSTLVERALGAIPGFTNIGELIDLCRRVAPRNERCGCGLPFLACPFWTAVGKKSFGGWDELALAELHELQTRVARQRHLPRLLRNRGTGAFADDVSLYGDLYRELYAAIAEVAGADFVVDASKWPAQALALARGGIDLRVIHLVREVHGVAHSQAKRGVARPHSDGDLMSTNGIVEAAARWTITQAEVGLLRRAGVPVARLRYEDLVLAPGNQIRSALAELEVPTSASALPHVRGTTLTLGPSHGLSGNPSRFRDGEITLHADAGWRSEMGPLDKLVVSAVAAPATVSTRRGKVERLRAKDEVTRAAMTGAWPPVSVIVPTHGRPDLVRLAVRSVMDQTYEGMVRCIVVHDQEEPEPSLEDLGRAQNRAVLVTTNTASPGLAGARNTGLDLVTDAFVASCDDDDMWHPRKLELQIRRLLDEPDLLVVGSGIRLLLPNGKAVEWPGRNDRIERNLLLRNRVKELHSSTLVMRHDAFAKAGRYDERLPNGYAEDYDWVLRVSRVGRIGVVRQPLADIRKNVQSYYAGQAALTVTALEHFLDKHPEITHSRRGHARILGQIAFNRAGAGQSSQGARDAAHALARWPLSPYPYLALLQLGTGLSPDRIRRAVRLTTGRGMA